MLIKKVGIKIKVLRKLFRTTVVSMTTKSHNQLKFLNLVMMATTTICTKNSFFYANKEGSNKNIGFRKII